MARCTEAHGVNKSGAATLDPVMRPQQQRLLCMAKMRKTGFPEHQEYDSLGAARCTHYAIQLTGVLAGGAAARAPFATPRTMLRQRHTWRATCRFQGGAAHRVELSASTVAAARDLSGG